MSQPEKAPALAWGACHIPIIELFGPTVQGEGALCGQVSYFLRTGNCTFRCSWCDSMHAVDPKLVKKNRAMMTSFEILKRIQDLAPEVPAWVTLTGGDPVIWDLASVISGLHLNGFRVAVETQAVLWKDWLEACDLVTASPKGPSSGMVDKFDVAILQKYEARLGDRWVIKIVCFDDEDLEWAGRIHAKFPGVKFYLSSGTPVDGDVGDILGGYTELVEKVLRRPLFHDVTILPQLHTLTWPGEKLGR
jgi:7-carboxy-7-deazaguanine synthase